MNTSSASACFYSAKTQSLLFSPSSLISVPRYKYQLSSVPSQFRIINKSSSRVSAVEMGRKELERELEEWVVGISGDGRCSSCVGEGGGGGNKSIVEVMECLEREAIMGADEGREPTDYYRRAHIFDNSSRLFQALKDTTTTTQQQDQY